MLSLEKITFSYDEKTKIFDNISLDFDLQSTAIIGQNGAGKSTLVKLIKGLLEQQSGGEILYQEQSTAQMSAKEIASYIGLVFQNPDDQIFKSTVIDEVMFGPLAIHQTHEQAKASSLKAIEAVGLAGSEEKNPYDLSLSDRKMIAIASIIAMDTQVVIFDEPTIAQDKVGKERIKKIMQQLENDGKLVIAILHDMDFVAEYFDRTVILAQGQVLYDGKTIGAFNDWEILNQAKLEKPHILQLAEELKMNTAVLTVDEFIRVWKDEK